MTVEPLGDLRRLAAFSDDAAGGNPAGVWRGEELPSPARMQQIAAEVGYSETAFLVPTDPDRWLVRYYSPEREIDFCGHATIASAVSQHEATNPAGGIGTFLFSTLVGPVPVTTTSHHGPVRATLTSVEPAVRTLPDQVVTAFLAALGWRREQLDPTLPIQAAYAGAWHLVVAVGSREILARLDYDFDALRGLMLEHGLTTVQAIHRADETTFDSRNPFPVGGVVEDPATGAAAAALGGYLRAHGFVRPPKRLTIRQGEDMGRPSVIEVGITVTGGIEVTGTAVTVDDPPGSRGGEISSAPIRTP